MCSATAIWRSVSILGVDCLQAPLGRDIPSEQRQLSMDNFTILPHLMALSVAYALAFPIAWDREKASRSAGLRTFPLVALAACGFVQAAEGIAASSPEAMARIIAGLITGVGFVGGGAIIKHGSSVRGTATAASLWATGAMGGAVGLGNYDVAVMISAFTFVTLRFLRCIQGGRRAERPGGPAAIALRTLQALAC